MIQQIINRLKADTPVFFKHLRNMALSIGSSCLAALSICSVIGLDNLVLLSVLKYVTVALAFVAGTAQLTKEQN